jgi:hypothetical protein
MKPSKGQTVALSLEDHGVALSNADTSSAVATNTSLPALTARYEYGRRFALAGMIREMDVEMPAIDDSELSWGVYAQYAQPLWPSATFKSALWVGEGIGSYVSPRTADGYVENGEVEAVEHASGYVAIEQKWSPRVSSTFVLSRIQRSDVPDTLAATERRRVDSVWANIFYDIMPRVSFGLEYVYAKSERFNGRDDDASRINAMMMTQF